MKHRCHEVTNNEVKIRGKIPVNIEYENNKQKMQLLNTKRNDITLLLGLDWLKEFKLTIGIIRLDQKSQLEKRRNIQKCRIKTYN